MYFNGEPVYRLILWGEDDVTAKYTEGTNRWIYHKDEDDQILMKCIHLINGNEMLMWVSPTAFEVAFERYFVSAAEELEEFEDEHIFGNDEEDIL